MSDKPKKWAAVYDDAHPPSPWERLPRETARAFSMMQYYMKMGPEKRTHRKVAEKFGVTVAACDQHAMKYGWKLRAVAWDNRNLEVERKAEEKVRAENARKWARREEKAQEGAWTRVEKIAGRIETMIDRAERDGASLPFTPGALVKLLKLTEILSRLEGKAVAEGKGKAEDDQFDPATATPDECRAYLARHGLKAPDAAQTEGPAAG